MPTNNVSRTIERMALRSLQARRYLPDFTRKGIDYLRTGTVPRTETNPVRFRKRWDQYRLQDNKLFYHNREVITTDKINDTLKEEYKIAGEIGRDRFYAYLKSKYLGISILQVASFLKHSETHQLHTRPHKEAIIRPIVVSGPRKLWQMDLVDFTSYRSPQNQNTNYLLSVIDVFSKFAYVIPLPNKTAATLAEKLREIFAIEKPSSLQSDNGTEFKNDDMTRLATEFHIKQIFSRPYTPQSQGCVERFNGTIKRMIFGYMTQHATRVYVPHLQDIVKVYNETQHSATKKAPYKLHHVAQAPTVRIVAKRLRKRADKMMTMSKHKALQEGDKVRLLLKAVDALVRRSTYRRAALPQWSREVYTISRVIRAHVRYGHNYYVVAEIQGRRFRREEVQKVEEATFRSGRPISLPAPAADDEEEDQQQEQQQQQPPEPRARRVHQPNARLLAYYAQR